VTTKGQNSVMLNMAKSLNPNHVGIISPLLDINEIDDLNRNGESDESDSNAKVLESVSDRQESFNIRDSELERWEFPEELNDRGGIHIPLIHPHNSNYHILVGDDIETPQIGQFMTIRRRKHRKPTP
jgi:hypothetical protein